ncbi:unnamed protein product, partial [Mesorhabditis belari]|uniref:Pyridoxal phosphate homeostasis protein n=1 Tax=Mesorhabditis belari TaxID=2138241 RepID=A0AAF3FNC4_9BILA
MSVVETVIQSNLKQILETIHLIARECGRTTAPRLVAVSKTKPSNLILECYQAGQKHFGENYVQELEEKGAELRDLQDIKWHYIGQMQSNKISKICAVPNLYCIETLDNEKHAQLLEKEMNKRGLKVKVLIQVNTSDEEQKGGLQPNEAKELGKFVDEQCAHLEFSGFMTIGSVAGSSMTPNPDFEKLREVRDDFAKEVGRGVEGFELSMGMSDDFRDSNSTRKYKYSSGEQNIWTKIA